MSATFSDYIRFLGPSTVTALFLILVGVLIVVVRIAWIVEQNNTQSVKRQQDLQQLIVKRIYSGDDTKNKSLQAVLRRFKDDVVKINTPTPIIANSENTAWRLASGIGEAATTVGEYVATSTVSVVRAGGTLASSFMPNQSSANWPALFSNISMSSTTALQDPNEICYKRIANATSDLLMPTRYLRLNGNATVSVQQNDTLTEILKAQENSTGIVDTYCNSLIREGGDQSAAYSLARALERFWFVSKFWEFRSPTPYIEFIPIGERYGVKAQYQCGVFPWTLCLLQEMEAVDRKTPGFNQTALISNRTYNS